MDAKDTLALTPVQQPAAPARARRSRAGGGSVFKSNPTLKNPRPSPYWQIGYYVSPGRQVVESSKSTVKSVAMALLQNRLEALRHGVQEPQRADKILVSELFADLLLKYKTDQLKTIDDCESRLRNHLAPFFNVTVEVDAVSGKTASFTGGMRAVAVTDEHAQKFILLRREQGAKLATVHNELTLLKRAFSLAVQKRKLPVKPFIGLPKNADVARSGFVTVEQYRTLLSHLPENLRPLLSLAVYAGMRKGEILSLKWSQVDLERGTLSLSALDTKTHAPRIVPISSEPLMMLRNLKVTRDSLCPSFELVFHRLPRPQERNRGPALLPLGDFRKAWEEACCASSLGEMVGPEGAKVYRGLLFHDLRRSGARFLIRSGIHPHVTMKITGHKTDSMLRRYNIVDERDLRDAAKRLGDYMNAPTPEQPRIETAQSHVPELETKTIQ
jgi:integrase